MADIITLYSTAERMDSSEYSLELIVLPQKEFIAETNFFWKETLLLKEVLKQKMTASSPVKINTIPFK